MCLFKLNNWSNEAFWFYFYSSLSKNFVTFPRRSFSPGNVFRQKTFLKAFYRLYIIVHQKFRKGLNTFKIRLIKEDVMILKQKKICMFIEPVFFKKSWFKNKVIRRERFSSPGQIQSLFPDEVFPFKVLTTSLLFYCTYLNKIQHRVKTFFSFSYWRGIII